MTYRAYSTPSRGARILQRGGGDVVAVKVEEVAPHGFDPLLFGTHSLRRAKAKLIYRRTGNLRAVQILLGHTKIESNARDLGIECTSRNQRPHGRRG